MITYSQILDKEFADCYSLEAIAREKEIRALIDAHQYQNDYQPAYYDKSVVQEEILSAKKALGRPRNSRKLPGIKEV